MSQGMNRRVFLQLAGTGLAAGCTSHRAPEKVVPFLDPPEHIVPGEPLFYRTVCRECAAGCGVTARTREGRVVKLEGNPDDPISGGALCARGQAALQGLYAPDRLGGPLRRRDGRLIGASWDEAYEVLGQAVAAARAKGPGAIRLLTRPEPGAAGALQRAFLGALGAGPDARVVLEPFDMSALRRAGASLFGRAELPGHDLGAARTVVAFGADFLETWLSPVVQTRDFMSGRGRVGPERTRLVWISPRLSATGAVADQWLSVLPGGERWVALGLLAWIVDPAHGVGGLAPEAPLVAQALAKIDVAEAERRAGLEPGRIAWLGSELAARRPSALLGPGVAAQGDDATELAALVLLTNYLLGNVGRTVLYGQDPGEDPASSFAAVQSLVADLASGHVDVLFVHHADVVGTLPAALGAAAALARTPLVVSFGDRPDPTTALSALVLPDHHPLESFGDVTVRKGVVGLAQPVMTPLGDTRAAPQVLLDLAGKLGLDVGGATTFQDYLEARTLPLATAAAGATGDADQEARLARQRGGYFSSEPRATLTLATGELDDLLAAPASPASEADLALLPFPTALRHDGSAGELPWLSEVPDSMTTISWSSWAELAPSTAARLGVETGDGILVGGPAGDVELAAYVRTGLREGVVAVPLGGPEVLALLPARVDRRSGGLAFVGAQVTARRSGREIRLARAEGTPRQEGREIVRSVSAAAPTLKRPAPAPEMYPPPSFPQHRWAMAIDLDRCSGCQACAVACYAENNVSVVGPQRLAENRSMAWLRIERYLDGPPEAPRADFLPMLCQQCGNAPCEPVCPVYATYHTSDGLNAQIYNRCVGTRYCANNCPYEVRAFNFDDPSFPAPLDLQLNPEVTVRSRGVMEKCSFCVQRIRVAKRTAEEAGRPIADGEVQPACVQTCPGKAMVFGDANDATSRVAAWAKSGRAYHVLDELNTLPAITYLASVRDKP